MNRKLLERIRLREAINAVGPSAHRGQGMLRAVDTLRTALYDQVPLERFGTSDPRAFARALDRATIAVMRRLPRRGGWGLARKYVNIFLRGCLYNHYLRKRYRLHRAEQLLEVPLDSIVARELRRHWRQSTSRSPRFLPAFKIKTLVRRVNQAYQAAALRTGDSLGIERVHLDAVLWSTGKTRSGAASASGKRAPLTLGPASD